MRPYLSGGIGSFHGTVSSFKAGAHVVAETESMSAFGGQVGGGVDMPLGSHFMLGTNAAYNLISDFDKPLAGKRNFSGFELSVGLGYLFGKGSPPVA